MKSLIQWKKSKGSITSYNAIPQVTKHYTGKIENCDFYINIYNSQYGWHWSIRSAGYSQNLVIGNKSYKTLKAAKADAVKWTLVQMLIRIDPDMFRGIKNEHYTIPWLESFIVVINGRSIPQLNPFRSNTFNLGKRHNSDKGVHEHYYSEIEGQQTTITLGNTVKPRKSRKRNTDSITIKNSSPW